MDLGGTARMESRSTGTQVDLATLTGRSTIEPRTRSVAGIIVSQRTDPCVCAGLNPCFVGRFDEMFATVSLLPTN
eukprot:3927686-Rhodomonas_salina.2